MARALYANNLHRRNPAVTSPERAAKAFVFVAQALEAETLSGQSATRVVQATKNLVQGAEMNIGQIMGRLTPEQQAVVQAYFS